MALFPRDLEQWKDAALIERWAQLAAVRNQVNLQLEEKRKDKTITANLSARVALEADGETAKLLSEYESFLPTLFGVSEVTFKPSSPSASAKASADKQAVKASVERAEGTKCERCWRYVPSVSHEGLCPRCVEALGESR